jgi:cytochrome c553
MENFRVAAAGVMVAALLGSPLAQGQATARGQALYDGICRGCHGFPPAGGPETVAGDATRINAAFDKRSPMSALRGVLSPVDISDIADYLATLASLPPATPAHDVTDLWWNAGEPGWGLSLTQHPSHAVFGVLFVYDASNRPTWLTLPGGRWTSPTTFAGRFYATQGPAHELASFDSALVTARQVGAASLTFTARDRATLVYTVDGRLATKTITRQPF